MKRIINTTIIVLSILLGILWILSVFIKPLEITNELIIRFSLILLIYFVVKNLVNLFHFKNLKNKSTFIATGAIIISEIVLATTNYTDVWKTQTILYEHEQLKNKSIEFQMLDLGSFGYNRRIVEVTKLTFFIRYVEPIDTSMISAPWIKANKHINELKLKGG
ncbi:hypothetical protein [Carboxylicivirga caseinilyticus]|uniref:hypothetical protein n=1 Tax=Carboxylicivirga caseinilyticus TaxID=3417572 RepID=UPI003D32CE3B|nr:hypothetical protein [Marinilabiliaceae bacterium A049]